MPKRNTKLNIIRAIAYAAFFVFITYLFYLECTDVLVSDIPTHINQAVKSFHAYSVLSLFISFAHGIAGEFGVAVLLGILEIATIFLCEMFMRRLMPDVHEWAVFACAFCINVAIAIYVPFVHPYLTRGLAIGQAWHNTTYIAMRLVGVGAIWAYLRYIGHLDSKNHKLDYLAFTVLVVLAVGTKPNFALSFAPTVVVLCIYDLVKHGTATLKRSLLLAIPFVLALAFIPLQSAALYGSGTSSGIGIGFFSVWRKFHHFLPIGILQSFAFPLIVLYACARIKFKDRNFQLAWIMLIVSFLIYAFLKETGTRKYHGNFGWGLMFATYYIMLTSICAYLQTRKAQLSKLLAIPLYKPDSECERSAPAPNGAPVCTGQTEETTKGPITSKAFDICCLALFAWHTISGLISFGSILIGNGYA